MHSDQCFRLSAKQSTVYPPRDSTRVSRKKTKKRDLCSHDLHGSQLPKRLRFPSRYFANNTKGQSRLK